MTSQKRRASDNTQKKRPRHLYVSEETHKEVRILAANFDAEMGEVTEAAMAAFLYLDEQSQWEWIKDQQPPE